MMMTTCMTSEQKCFIPSSIKHLAGHRHKFLCPTHKLQASVDHPTKQDEQIILSHIRSPDCRNGFTSFVPAAKWHIWDHPPRAEWAAALSHDTRLSQAPLRWKPGLISGVNTWAQGSKHCTRQLTHSLLWQRKLISFTWTEGINPHHGQQIS